MNYIYLCYCHNVPNYEIAGRSMADDLKDFFANKHPKFPTTSITFKAAQFKGRKSKQIDMGI